MGGSYHSLVRNRPQPHRLGRGKQSVPIAVGWIIYFSSVRSEWKNFPFFGFGRRYEWRRGAATGAPGRYV